MEMFDSTNPDSIELITSLIIMTPSFDFYNIVHKNKVVFGFHIWLNC